MPDYSYCVMNNIYGEHPYRRLLELKMEYRERIQPFIDLLCDVENITMHRYICNGAQMEVIRNYSPEAKKLREQCLKSIDEIRSEIEGRRKEPDHERRYLPMGLLDMLQTHSAR